ncbi:MAG: hypothetical protein OHK006_05150 [Thermodesulfovibrionales bacterium]
MVIIKMPERIKTRFSRYIGIDYSGAETPDSSMKGLRVYEASRRSKPVECSTNSAGGSISGRSTAGKFLRENLRWWRSAPVEQERSPGGPHARPARRLRRRLKTDPAATL